MPNADGCERDQDRHADKGAGYAPEHSPEENRKQHHKVRHRNRSSGDTGLDITADDKLKDVKANEHNKSGVERFELCGCQKGGQQGGNERSDKGYEVENEGDHPPFALQLKAITSGEHPE